MFIDDFIDRNNKIFNKYDSYQTETNLKITYCFFGSELTLINNKLAENRRTIKNQLAKININCQEVIFAKQVHGNNIIEINQHNLQEKLQNTEEGDAIVSNLTELAIAVVTADCLPILLFDLQKQVIVAIHCGWRGAIENIISNTILKIKNKYHANNLVAIIGPAIQQDSYQVGWEFYEKFINYDKNNQQFFVSDPQNYYSEQQNKKWLFDLPNFATKQLQRLGVRHIINSKINTFTNKEYHSFRRSQKTINPLETNHYQRNIAAITINKI